MGRICKRNAILRTMVLGDFNNSLYFKSNKRFYLVKFGLYPDTKKTIFFSFENSNILQELIPCNKFTFYFYFLDLVSGSKNEVFR